MIEHCFRIIRCKPFKDLLEKYIHISYFLEFYLEAGRGKEEQGRRGFLKSC